MEEWITPAVIMSIATGFFTYLGTRSQTQLQKDNVAFDSMEKRLIKLEAKVDKLQEDLDIKNELLAEKERVILQQQHEINDLKEENGYLLRKLEKKVGKKNENV